jgi:diaminopimelate epimerase
VFFVGDVDAIDLETIGPILEHHPLFPERANISAAQVRPDHSIRLRVWERGVGVTKACGTAACATIVAAVRRQLIPGRSAPIELDGGVLEMAWTEDNHVTMTGPVATSFSGLIDPALLNGSGGT